MVGKKSGRALLREEGLQRTDNNMDFTNWPQANMINQKNYYTHTSKMVGRKVLDGLRKGKKDLYALNVQYVRSEFLKRDDQSLALRLQHEERLNAQKKAAVDTDRARAFADQGGAYPDADQDLDEDVGMDDTTSDNYGSKTIVIHIGSQNLRLGLATDALPKTVPMVIARKSIETEAEACEPRPKRLKLDVPSEEQFGDEFASEYNSMAQDFKVSRRANKRRVLPNSRELVTKWNSTNPPDKISAHNDPHHIDWTEIPPNPKQAPDYIVGSPALRIPEKSNPRYRLYWPIRQGWLNEKDYSSRNMLMRDFFLILEESIKNELGLTRKKDWSQYSCVFIIPDLYEKAFVGAVLDELIRDFTFSRICFQQESVAASFGAGYSIACMVDIGAQKTSICCVEDGMCVEDARINLKYGGYDVTETFAQMILFDKFNYADFNLMRRHDYLLAEELKMKHTSLSDENISVQLHEFHLRAHGQETRKYEWKIYDEGYLAPMGLFRPSVFNNGDKLEGRHKLIAPYFDTYDGKRTDPISKAQLAVAAYVEKNIPSAVEAPAVKAAKLQPTPFAPTPSKQKMLGLPSHLNGENDGTPRSSVAGSPPPEDQGTPQPSANEGGENGNGDADGYATVQGAQPDTDTLDRTVPLMPLDQAILTSIHHASIIPQTGALDERKRRDFLGSIMLIGGGSKTPFLGQLLETRLRASMPQYPKEILVAPPPRDLDPEVIVWKGGSVFGKLRMTNDAWIVPLEYDRLGARILNYKVMWAW